MWPSVREVNSYLLFINTHIKTSTPVLALLKKEKRASTKVKWGFPLGAPTNASKP
jgi:hypothetical protein